ncbi:MAG: alpha/beta fold hydrolase BchO [Pseudomonadota bacterium]
MLSWLDKPDWKREGRLWPHADKSVFVDVGLNRFRVERFGRGPTALLIHGTGASAHSWAGLATLLAKDYEVVAVDLPGHGFTQTSARFRPTPANVADALGDLLETLGVSPRLVVGHSAGAVVMVHMALRGRVAPDLLVSVNGALTQFDGPAAVAFPIMAKALTLNPFVPTFFAQAAKSRRRVDRLIGQTGSQIPADYVDCYAALFARAGHVSGALALMAFWDLTTIDADLAAVDAPMLFVAGENDRAVPAAVSERAAARVRRGRYVPLTAYGHLAHEEDPAAVAEALSAALVKSSH